MARGLEAWAAVDDPFETEDEDLCPLCMDELDISDLNFRPCPCGYRLCRFCWHHIKENLNGRCPGCRKEYDDSVIEFKPMKADELKRLQQAKKQKDRERRDLELMNRKHLSSVRVKQKNQVHIQGLTTKMANEDTMAQLKGSELFTRYGRVLKIFMSRRTGSTSLYTPDHRYQHVNVYINYSKDAEAAACVSGLDGTSLPDGHRIIASLGTTKYCSSFLRGVKCPNENCTLAHELADEEDSYVPSVRESREDPRSHHKDVDHRSRNATVPSSTLQQSTTNIGLPASVSWAHKAAFASSSQPASPSSRTVLLSASPLEQPTSSAPRVLHALPPRPVGPTTGSSPAPATSRSRMMSTVDPKSYQLSLQEKSSSTNSAGGGVNITHSPPSILPPPSLPSLLRPGNADVPESLDDARSQPPLQPPPGLDISNAVLKLEAVLPTPISYSAPYLNGASDAILSNDNEFSFNMGIDHKGKQRATRPTDSFSLAPLSAGLPDIHPPRTSQLQTSVPHILSDFASSIYRGSFDPFSDLVKAGQSTKEDDSPPSNAVRRSSRFDFARSEGPASSSAPTSTSPTRGTISEPPGLQRQILSDPITPSATSSPYLNGIRIDASSAQSLDASVLFPGVNLAACYSSSASSAMANRVVKTDPWQRVPLVEPQQHFSRAYGPLHSHSLVVATEPMSDMGSDINNYRPGQFGTEFRDPAIVNIRPTAHPPTLNPPLSFIDGPGIQQFSAQGNLNSSQRGGLPQESFFPMIRQGHQRQWHGGQTTSRPDQSLPSMLRLL